MAWFGWKMAWFIYHLVQLLKFWTSIALKFVKWQLFKQGYCCLYQRQQLSYISMIYSFSFVASNILFVNVNYQISSLLLNFVSSSSIAISIHSWFVILDNHLFWCFDHWRSIKRICSIYLFLRNKKKGLFNWLTNHIMLQKYNRCI
jgi:hypothetical protein